MKASTDCAGAEGLTSDSVRQQLKAMLDEVATKQVFDTEAAAEYLSVSRQLLELLRVEGGGPRYAKLGRLVRYRRAALDAWLIDRERVSTSGGGK